ncbi:MAG: hypothetical protein CSA66_03270 [Proteobacteria bacterium]|nr:MAG: hypothetical protein CSA66_03270 [Pseudomonadota bacterium]
MIRRGRAPAWLLVVAVALSGCPDDPVDGGADAVDVVDHDTADAPAREDAGADAEVVALTEPGQFVPGTADLPEEFLFKGVWAGEPGVVVAVGSDGVVASRDAGGAWSILTRAEGAELLNAVHGAAGDRLWAVGLSGAVLPGTTAGFGSSSACDTASDCEDFDPCTIDLCTPQGVCDARPSGLSGCCGSVIGSWDFDDGALGEWRAGESFGGLAWTVSSARSVSGAWSLYFGDPTKVPPDYDTGLPVGGVVTGPTVTLPESGTIGLRLSVYMDTEPGPDFDALSVELQIGASVVEVWRKAQLAVVPTGGFVDVEVDLTPFAGSTVAVRFRFDSQDATSNDSEGTYVDDVVIDSRCAASGAANLQSGATLWGVYAVADDLAFAVGRAGEILRWDGVAWEKAQTSDTSVVWNGLAGANGNMALVGHAGKASVALGAGLVEVELDERWNINDVDTFDGEVFWAVGDEGRIYRGQGVSWATMPSPTSVSLRAVHAVSNTDVWAVGYLGVVAHFDGVEWKIVDVGTTTDLLGIYVDGGGVVTATGRDGVLIRGDLTSGFAVPQTLHDGGALADVWVAETGETFLVGTGGMVVAFEGGAWAVQASTVSHDLQAVFGFAADDVWAVGRAGTVIHWDGEAWLRAEVPVSASLNALWGDAPNNLFAAGSGGALLLWNGSGWGSLAGTTDANLRAVFGLTANDVWAVGAGGTIMRFNGLGWGLAAVEKIPNSDGGEDPITDELHAVWAYDHDDAWAVGANGRVLHWDGQLWSRSETDWEITLRGVFGVASNDVWAVGNAGHAIHWNGEAWQLMETGSVATLHHIHGDGAGHVVAVGAFGTVLTLSRDQPWP